MELARIYVATIWSRKLSFLVAALLFPAMLFAGESASSVPRRTEIAATKRWSVRWQPMRVVNGTPVLFRVTAPAPLESLSGKWMEHEVFFNLDPANKTWFGIAGSSLQVRPGSYPLELK